MTFLHPEAMQKTRSHSSILPFNCAHFPLPLVTTKESKTSSLRALLSFKKCVWGKLDEGPILDCPFGGLFPKKAQTSHGSMRAQHQTCSSKSQSMAIWSSLEWYLDFSYLWGAPGIDTGPHVIQHLHKWSRWWDWKDLHQVCGRHQTGWWGG